MSLTINHQLNDIINSTGTITINGVAAGGDNTPATFLGSRGIFGGGDVSNTRQDIIDYITIDTTGNATDFGNLTLARAFLTGCSSGSRGVFAAGHVQSNTTFYNTIDYITIASTGNASDFGNLIASNFSLTATSGSHGGI